ncbi:nuclear factor NF-kappa-B p105 subunit-like [Sycon ciliatum]|uniref:nuclear factor NF-kappa-B p105 subunit-like n=1 Tax=Sycon ciliatum TaxID=27933 RepID=UPI0031F6D0C8
MTDEKGGADPTPVVPPPAPLLPTAAESNEQQNLKTEEKCGVMLAPAVEGKLPFPCLEIVEQPRQRGFRFRYPCEGPSHGGLPGEKSEKHRKSYPSVRLKNYLGRAKVVVSLVTSDDPAKPHAHRLIGRSVQNGICTAEIGAETDFKASFNLGILHATKKNVSSNLLVRFALAAQRIGGDGVLPESTDTLSWAAQPQEKELTEAEILESLGEERKAALTTLSKDVAAGMNLSVVRLCFQAYLDGPEGKFDQPLTPVVSHPVFDSKAPSSSSLKICRMDRCSGSVAGNDEVFLLCDRVQKDDVEVLFYDGPADGSDAKWTSHGLFSSSDVHRQFSIVFRTPPYHNLYVQSAVCVWIALRRKSDNEQSEPKSFLYQPLNMDPEKLASKRLKSVPNFSTEDYPSDGGGMLQSQSLGNTVHGGGAVPSRHGNGGVVVAPQPLPSAGGVPVTHQQPPVMPMPPTLTTIPVIVNSTGMPALLPVSPTPDSSPSAAVAHCNRSASSASPVMNSVQQSTAVGCSLPTTIYRTVANHGQ